MNNQDTSLAFGARKKRELPHKIRSSRIGLERIELDDRFDCGETNARINVT